MNPNLNKGNELERAVGLIEKLILEQNPNLKNNPFTIENKKIIIVNNVKHEVDWYIEIDLGDGYKSIYIFECKNWKEPIGKSEIIEFSELIRATSAFKGYFIAKQFGKYAVAQAELDPRMELLIAKDDLIPLIDYVDFHTIFLKLHFVRLEFLVDDPQGEVKELDTKTIFLNDRPVNFEEFAFNLGTKLMEDFANNLPTATFSSGVYKFETQKIYDYSDQSLLVEGISRTGIRAIIKFAIKVQHPKLLSKFDIEKRGRIIEYENLIFIEQPEKKKMSLFFQEFNFPE